MSAAALLLLSLVVTETPGPHMMHAGTVTKSFKTHEECVAAIPLTGGTCSAVTNVAKVGTCEDEKAPSVALVELERDGKKYWEIPTGAPTPPEPSEANGWAVMVWAYVKNPAGYPNCWVRGWAPENLWRLNPNYPGTPILELIVPGMADISEPPNSIEPVCKPDGPNDCPGQSV